jgi:hypothetical protein
MGGWLLLLLLLLLLTMLAFWIDVGLNSFHDQQHKPSV